MVILLSQHTSHDPILPLKDTRRLKKVLIDQHHRVLEGFYHVEYQARYQFGAGFLGPSEY